MKASVGTDLLCVPSGRSILSEAVLRSFKLKLLKGHASVPACGEDSPVLAHSNSLDSSVSTAPCFSRGASYASLKRSRSKEEEEALFKRAKLQPLVKSVKHVAVGAGDVELAAFTAARELVDWAEQFQFELDGASDSESDSDSECEMDSGEVKSAGVALYSATDIARPSTALSHTISYGTVTTEEFDEDLPLISPVTSASNSTTTDLCSSSTVSPVPHLHGAFTFEVQKDAGEQEFAMPTFPTLAALCPSACVALPSPIQVTLPAASPRASADCAAAGSLAFPAFAGASPFFSPRLSPMHSPTVAKTDCSFFNLCSPTAAAPPCFAAALCSPSFMPFSAPAALSEELHI